MQNTYVLTPVFSINLQINIQFSAYAEPSQLHHLFVTYYLYKLINLFFNALYLFLYLTILDTQSVPHLMREITSSWHPCPCDVYPILFFKKDIFLLSEITKYSSSYYTYLVLALQ